MTGLPQLTRFLTGLAHPSGATWARPDGEWVDGRYGCRYKTEPPLPAAPLHSLTRSLSHSHSSALSPVAAAGVFRRRRRHGSLPAVEDAVVEGWRGEQRRGGAGRHGSGAALGKISALHLGLGLVFKCSSI